MTKRFTVMVHGEESLFIRIEIKDMRLLETLGGPFSSMFNPVFFINTAPQLVRRFIKTEDLNPRFLSDEDALDFTRRYVDADGNAFGGLGRLYGMFHIALIEGGWLVNPLESGDIGNVAGAPKPKEPKDCKYFHEVVCESVEPLLLGYGLRFDEIDKLTPAEAKAIILSHGNAKSSELRALDMLCSGIQQAVLTAAGMQVSRDKCLTFVHEDVEEETIVYKDPETIEEEIEARLQCDRMAGTLRSMCKK